MKSLFLGLLAAFVLAGCAPFNSAYNAVLTQGVADYASAKQNIQATDDLKLRAFVDSSCAINIGALQRAVSTTGNPAIANGVFALCPVPGVGVTTNTSTGTMQVQTFSIPVTGITDKPAGQTTSTLSGGSSSVSTPAITAAPVTANTSAALTYKSPKASSRTQSRARAPMTAAPSANLQGLTPAPASPGAPAFGTLAPNPNFPTTPAPSSRSHSALPSALPGQ